MRENGRKLEEERKASEERERVWSLQQNQVREQQMRDAKFNHVGRFVPVCVFFSSFVPLFFLLR